MFAALFGTLLLHPNIQGSKADPAVIDIVLNPGDTKIICKNWDDSPAKFRSMRFKPAQTVAFRRCMLDLRQLEKLTLLTTSNILKFFNGDKN